MIYNSGRSLSIRVESIIHDGRWIWPRHRNRITKQIIEPTPPDFLPNPQVEDEVLWTPSTTGFYATKSVWDAIRPIGQKKPWCSVVWFNQNVSKWAFIVWLACLKRLATKDRLRDWGMTVPLSCAINEMRAMLTYFFLVVSLELCGLMFCGGIKFNDALVIGNLRLVVLISTGKERHRFQFHYM